MSAGWRRPQPLRTSPFATEGRRCRTTRHCARRAMPRDCPRSPRVVRVPIHAAARGEALRTRHRRGLRRRRGASPECSVSAGLHPSPGTVHPRRHQAGVGGPGEHTYSTGACANENGGQRNQDFISPGQSTPLVCHFHEFPGHRRFLWGLMPIFPGQRVLEFPPTRRVSGRDGKGVGGRRRRTGGDSFHGASLHRGHCRPDQRQ